MLLRKRDWTFFWKYVEYSDTEAYARKRSWSEYGKQADVGRE
jgi:hypothetical protein